MITMGFAKSKITPKLPCRLAGYLKYRVAQSVHDDLYARCILFRNDNDFYLVVQMDLLAVDYLLRDKLLAKLADFPIDSNHLLLCATHTHAGPVGVTDTFGMHDIFGEIDEGYIDECAAKISDAVHEAYKDMQPTTISVSHSKVDNVGKERHNPNNKGDDSLLYMELNRSDNKTVMIYNYACHPTVTGPENMQITKDLPCYVEEKWNADMVVFINSNAGDISTRFTRESSDFKQVDIFTQRILSALEDAKKHKKDLGLLSTISMETYQKEYLCKKMRSPEEAQQYLDECCLAEEKASKTNISDKEKRIISSYKEGAAVELQLSKRLYNQKSLPLMITLLNLQGILIAGIPGELFSTLGTKLKNEGIEVFGYANGYALYIADENAYDSGTYEALSSPFAKGVGEELVKEVLNKSKIFLNTI